MLKLDCATMFAGRHGAKFVVDHEVAGMPGTKAESLVVPESAAPSQAVSRAAKRSESAAGPEARSCAGWLALWSK